jgi:hypothetical protein
MEKRFVAQKLTGRLNDKIRRQIKFKGTLILGVVLKGLPVAYSLARMNCVVDNFVPLVAERHIYMQHQIESYFPSLDWKEYFSTQLSICERILIVDDVINTGFTKQKVESIVHSLSHDQEGIPTEWFAALVLNRRNLANPGFVGSKDFYSLEVNAADVECDWGLITVPLWDLSVEAALQRCEEYYRRFWKNEQRWITIAY